MTTYGVKATTATWIGFVYGSVLFAIGSIFIILDYCTGVKILNI